jgi:hypothetical protein
MEADRQKIDADAAELLKNHPNKTFNVLAEELSRKYQISYDDAFSVLKRIEWSKI